MLEANPSLEEKEHELTYLEMQADVGITKHIGGLPATIELIKMAGIKEGMNILDVGSGIGSTACFLAKSFGCNVVGIDVSQKMVFWANKKAEKMHVEEKVKFKIADATDLPFIANSFDVVFCESVIVFVKNREFALKEMFRVAKSGGTVAINEGCWLVENVPRDCIDYWEKAADNVVFPDENGWKKLLEKTGLVEIVSKTHKISYLGEMFERIRVMGFIGIIRAQCILVLNYITKPSYREYFGKIMKEVSRPPKKIFEYWGYGVFCGKKQ